ncbi:MAG: hypothetical protein LBN18_02670, partial [Dysgonamonadaceae bacterium]|nr:hypothetical protein [Dysgonamonadaceae bacterium]
CKNTAFSDNNNRKPKFHLQFLLTNICFAFLNFVLFSFLPNSCKSRLGRNIAAKAQQRRK